jgi:hypothetical protein
MDNLDICGRCLINPNATTYVAAVWQAKEGTSKEPAPHPTDPWSLKSWADSCLERDRINFEIDATKDRIIAIGTWHGDPVCSFHLWMLVVAEMRTGYR